MIDDQTAADRQRIWDAITRKERAFSAFIQKQDFGTNATMTELALTQPGRYDELMKEER